MNLIGRILPEVQLRFNRASKYATSPDTRSGIRRFGPYDADLFPQSQINCGIIYSPNLKHHRDLLVNGLIQGEGNAFHGFSTWFRTNIVFAPLAEKQPHEDESEVRRAAIELVNRNCDLVFIIVSRRNARIYRTCKSIFLSNGIACQVITTGNLQDSSRRPWVLSNVALAGYAKVGGTPWVVADTTEKRELIMGISRAQDEDKKYIVGFVTLFNHEGDFLFLYSRTPVVYWDQYVDGLENLVIDAYHEYESTFGVPESLVIHFHKRPGLKEIQSVNRALENLGQTIPFALLHLNEYSAFRLFDTTHNSYVPQSGLEITLSRHRSLLLLDGRVNDKRNRMGVPNVWDISMDKRSTISYDDFPRLVNQIHRFAKVNWRGFNARSYPVTINYSKLICDQVVEIGMQSWISMIADGKLRDKAWFL